MDKNAIKKYAVWARRELISRVSQRAALYEITDKGYGDASADSVLGRVMSAEEKRQRQALIAQIREKGFEQVMEEIAYTWFNRFIALRFMEVNGYLPSRVRVFTDDENNFKPQILAEAINMELEGLDMEKVYALKNANDDDALFKYMIIVQCNALSSILPGMFQRISDYTELLFPDNLLREGSVIEQMVSMIPEEDWTDQVQIIGWLYQAYITEQNELVYDGDMSKDRITKELLPAATTIYTPDWPVQYMVQNSLGRLWLEGHPNVELESKWKYYLDEAQQTPDVQKQMAEIQKHYSALKPEEILVIDPCAGSGHILCVLFDTLLQIYESYGYTAREAATSIVKNNLWGLDIDDRAAQLAYFAVMMKARRYDRRFFTREVQPHVYAIQESNSVNREHLNYLGHSLNEIERNDALKQMNALLNEFIDAKEYGSILHPSEYDWALLSRFVEDTAPNQQMSFEETGLDATQSQLRLIIAQGQALSQKYYVVVTNPPYLSNSRFSSKLDSYVKKNYAASKSDLCMIMYQRAVDSLCINKGFISFITTSSWMFLASFEQMRKHINAMASITSIVDFGTELFEGKVGHNPIVAWCSRRIDIDYTISAIRLVEYCYSRRDEKEPQFFNSANHFSCKKDSFDELPGAPIAYWVSDALRSVFNKGIPLNTTATIFEGLKTRDKDRFLRYWFEVCSTRWLHYAKGGAFRRWYGNGEYVVDWGTDGTDIRNFKKSSGANFQHYFSPTITYSAMTSKKFSGRFIDNQLFGGGGGGITNSQLTYYILAFVNSVVYDKLLNLFSSTMNFEVGQIGSQPLIVDNDQKPLIEDTAKNNIMISQMEWDSFEASWDFQRHPLVPPATEQHYVHLTDCWCDWEKTCNERFSQMKSNEEKLNRIFIGIYGLQGELTPDVDNKDVTVRKADLSRDVRSLISYAVGCMFGRYSLDKPGLAFAGGEWDASKYQTFVPDADAILPICDDEYFEDDIVGRFVKFVETVYGQDNLEENLRFIADALGGKGSSREIIRNYFINDFYADHLKVYQKHPIYWLFDSGKKNSFKCLIYMYRYQPDTIARIRTDYVHEQQSRYRTAIADLESRIANAGTGERVKLSKQLTKLQEQAEELRVYEEKIHHLADQMIRIDLDDGVKHNYAIFQDVLAKIK